MKQKLHEQNEKIPTHEKGDKSAESSTRRKKNMKTVFFFFKYQNELYQRRQLGNISNI